MAQMVVRGVKFWYDRGSSGYGAFSYPYAARTQDKPALLQAIERWLALMEQGGIAVRNVATAGTYVAKGGMHGEGLAVDIDAIELADGRKMLTRDEWQRPSELYMRTWAALMLSFNQVLSGYYNTAHRDHFHVDLGGHGIMGGNTSVGQFIQVGLRWSGYDPGSADGVVGAGTKSAYAKWWAWARGAGLVEAVAPPSANAGMGTSLANVILYGRRPSDGSARSVCYWEGVGQVPYVLVGEQAYVPLRQVAEGLGFEVDVSEYPRIGVSPPT